MRPLNSMLAVTARPNSMFAVGIVFLALICTPSQVQAEEPYSSTGWRPAKESVQWKINQYGKEGTELRYYFRNNTSNKVLVSGTITYTDTKGKRREEKFKTKVKPGKKKGGVWQGYVFFLEDSTKWKMSDFQYKSVK